MIREANIDFPNLPDEDFDDMLGTSTGAGAIFGVTGGVMEGALRTVAEELTGQSLDDIDFMDVRGIKGIKEAEVKIGDLNVKVAVASGLGNARKLLDAIKRGEKEYHFIEIMGCPGGCVTGGGQPIVSARIRNIKDPRILRAEATYEEDREKPIRKSHENPDIKKLYKEFLGEPNSHKAHELLHTFYTPREKYKKTEADS
jgi:NADP-reducing hydrogenase subunit HndD